MSEHRGAAREIRQGQGGARVDQRLHETPSSTNLRVLVTGAGGVLGSEVYEQLRRTAGVHVVGATSRGRPEHGVHAWRMGAGPRPPELAGRWDVVVHCAASTRWSMTPDEAAAANIAPMLALEEVVSPRTHLVHVSTAFAGGLTGSTESDDVADYRNAYEWSKAAGERIVHERFPGSTIYRPPLIIGRRRDGHVARFSGIYMFLRAASTGLAPALVAARKGLLDLVPVDDAAARVVALVTGNRPRMTRVDVIGRGAGALTVGQTLDVTQAALNDVRAANGMAPIPRPPLIEPDRWTRFYLPFARQHLTPRQLRTVTLLGEFQPYTSIETPFAVTSQVPDLTPALRTAIRHWADRYPAAALGRPRAWSALAAS